METLGVNELSFPEKYLTFYIVSPVLVAFLINMSVSFIVIIQLLEVPEWVESPSLKYHIDFFLRCITTLHGHAYFLVQFFF